MKQRQIVASTGKKPNKKSRKIREPKIRHSLKTKEAKACGVPQSGMRVPKILRVSYLN